MLCSTDMHSTSRLRSRILPGGLTLMVHDDGVGFPAVIEERHGMGLRIMHHRARMIGATLEVQCEDARGYVGHLHAR